jgi:hypothetical protein
MAAAKASAMNASAKLSDWSMVSPELQVALSREALRQARQVIGAQAGLLAEQMDAGALTRLDGPDALRLLAMILAEEDPLLKAA